MTETPEQDHRTANEQVEWLVDYQQRSVELVRGLAEDRDTSHRQLSAMVPPQQDEVQIRSMAAASPAAGDGRNEPRDDASSPASFGEPRTRADRRPWWSRLLRWKKPA